MSLLCILIPILKTVVATLKPVKASELHTTKAVLKVAVAKLRHAHAILWTSIAEPIHTIATLGILDALLVHAVAVRAVSIVAHSCYGWQVRIGRIREKGLVLWQGSRSLHHVNRSRL